MDREPPILGNILKKAKELFTRSPEKKEVVYTLRLMCGDSVTQTGDEQRFRYLQDNSGPDSAYVAQAVCTVNPHHGIQTVIEVNLQAPATK